MAEDQTLVDELIKEAEELIQTFPSWTFTKMMRANHLSLQILVIVLEKIDGRNQQKEQGSQTDDPFAY